MHIILSVKSLMAMLQHVNVSLCVGGSKGKVGIQLKSIPERRDTTEMYPGKVMNIISV